ncbi:hypothetical protein IAR55_006760 [Kwoniella newhampshirensis]|uniref:Uncharacterized protein n=1 Tax=Kwoniella newhampshirensis TaxID=1651941 RepID=A0AAW0YTL6_9TREE
MATKVLRTQQTYAAKRGNTPHKVDERIQVVDRDLDCTLQYTNNLSSSTVRSSAPNKKDDQPAVKPGIGIGGASHRSTPPKDQDSKSSGRPPGKTPSTRAKVLPWVQELQTEESSIPEGMFGPYPSRPQSMAEAPLPPAQSRHPFAYSTGPTLPFAAFGAEHPIEEQRRHRRAETEVMSRGAGIKAISRPATALPGGGRGGEETPGQDSLTSPGMGTFGLDGKTSSAQGLFTAAKLTGGGSTDHYKYITRRSPPADRLPLNPVTTSHHTPAHTKPDSDEHDDAPDDRYPHLHRPHHELPFSPAEAQGRQLEAMEEARAAALAQLEAAQRNPDIMMEQEMMVGLGMEDGIGQSRGPRQTFDTTTSGPSFGHILHQDGFPPTSAQPSRQSPMEGMGPRQVGGVSDPSFFRILFGVPMGMTAPRSMMVMRDSGRARLGLGIPSLFDILDSPVVDKRGPEDRSAFVETVEDEDDPAVRTQASTPSPNLRREPAAHTTGRSTVVPEFQPAGPVPTVVDSAPFAPRSSTDGFDPYPVHLPTPLKDNYRMRPTGTNVPIRSANLQNTTAHSRAGKAPSTISQASASPRVPSVDAAPLGPTAKRSDQPRQVPTVISQRTVIDQPDKRTVYSVRTKNTPTIISDHRHPEGHGESESTSVRSSMTSPPPESVAPTTISNVKKLVAESKFHDETLCQLLDAARLNLIGDEAKKALQRAARARVIELRDLKGKGQLEEAMNKPVPATTRDDITNEFTPKREEQVKSRGKTRISESHAKARSDRTEMPIPPQVQGPPTWAEDIMSRLQAFDARFAAIERGNSETTGASVSDKPEDRHSQVTQDIPGNLIDELIFHELPSSGFTNGINMPRGLSQSIIFPQQPPMISMPGASASGQPLPSHYSHKTLHQISLAGTRVDGKGSPHASRTRYTQAHSPQTAQSQHTQRPTNQVMEDHNGRQQSRKASQPSSTITRSGANTSGSGPVIEGRDEEVPFWGSEVELPQPGENVHFPRAPTIAPTINILAPTESNPGGKGSTRAPSNSAISIAASRAPTKMTPDRIDITVVKQQAFPETAVPRPQERDLPSPHSESVKYQRPSPALSKSRTLDESSRTKAYTAGRATIQSFQPDMYPPPPFNQVPKSVSVFQAAQTSRAGAQSPAGRKSSGNIHKRARDQIITPPKPPFSPTRDVIHVIDPLFANAVTAGWQPWDRLSQTLYSWAIIAEEKSFVRALEEISLGRQVEEFPLSIFLMMTFKRWVKRNMSESPPVPCDKLFVPPNLAVAMNVAVHNRRYHEAKEILLSLWDSLGSKEPPRVIVSLAPLGNEVDQWAAHRYDLVSKHLTTYRVSHLAEIQTDGRSFWWWEAIRQAWPQLHIPDMENLERRGGQRVINQHRQPEWRHENSLLAANISRNLLLGYRPERQHDLTRLRELVWAEVKRLLVKKRKGRLLVGSDPYDP